MLPQQDRYTTGIVTYVAGDADNGQMARNKWVDQDQYYVDENGKWDPERGKTQGGWKSDTRGKWYQNSDGTYPVNEWVDQNRYYVDGNGEWVRNYT